MRKESAEVVKIPSLIIVIATILGQDELNILHVPWYFENGAPSRKGFQVPSRVYSWLILLPKYTVRDTWNIDCFDEKEHGKMNKIIVSNQQTTGVENTFQR